MSSFSLYLNGGFVSSVFGLTKTTIDLQILRIGNMEKLSDSNHVKFLPVPPPLPPSYSETIHHHHRNRPTREHFHVSAASNHRLDHLFDEGYRADVSINTDDGGVIYAHASILVSF